MAANRGKIWQEISPIVMQEPLFLGKAVLNRTGTTIEIKGSKRKLRHSFT